MTTNTRFIPGVLNWSYHRTHGSRWAGTVDSFIDSVVDLAEEFAFTETGIEFGIGGEQNQLRSRDQAYLEELQSKLSQHHLIPVIIVGQLQIHPEQEVVANSLDECVRNLELAKSLGAKVVTHGIVQHGRVGASARVRIYTELVARLSEEAQKLELQVCCAENFASFNSEDMKSILAGAGQSNLGVLNDLGNWVVLGEDPLEATQRLAAQTFHVHIKDYRNNHGIWRSVPLGQGSIDLSAILTALRKETLQDKLILSIETDLDAGDEHESVCLSAEYLLPWLK